MLGDLLGRGGMAEVFAGHSVGDHGFQKPVAIKRLLPELANDEVFVERLIEEAKLLVGMQHGNIVSVLDLAREGDDVFLVMEFVDGPSLRQLIKARGSRGLSLGVASYIVQSAAAGLEFAHVRPGGAIIHADISPSNLLLTTSGEVRVADFGIARREGGGHGVVEGKWAYMAPEQARGEPLTPRSDVFALGVVLYELLTGQHPFGRAVTANQRDDQMPVIPPRVVKQSVPHGLDAICMRALAHDPRDRYGRMQQLIDALVEERFANGYREAASDLAQAIREATPNADVGAPRTMHTDRPVTIMTQSLLRDAPKRDSARRGEAPKREQSAAPKREQPAAPKRESMAPKREQPARRVSATPRHELPAVRDSAPALRESATRDGFGPRRDSAARRPSYPLAPGDPPPPDEFPMQPTMAPTSARRIELPLSGVFPAVRIERPLSGPSPAVSSDVDRAPFAAPVAADASGSNRSLPAAASAPIVMPAEMPPPNDFPLTPSSGAHTVARTVDQIALAEVAEAAARLLQIPAALRADGTPMPQFRPSTAALGEELASVVGGNTLSGHGAAALVAVEPRGNRWTAIVLIAAALIGVGAAVAIQLSPDKPAERVENVVPPAAETPPAAATTQQPAATAHPPAASPEPMRPTFEPTIPDEPAAAPPAPTQDPEDSAAPAAPAESAPSASGEAPKSQRLLGVVARERDVHRAGAASSDPTDRRKPVEVKATPRKIPGRDANRRRGDKVDKLDKTDKREGLVYVRAEPWAWATIGEERRETPHRFSRAPGTYTVKLHNSQTGISKTVRVTIKPGEMEQVFERMDR